MSVGDRDYKQIVRDAIDSIGEDIELKIDKKDVNTIHLHEAAKCLRRSYYDRKDPLETEQTQFNKVLGGLFRKMKSSFYYWQIRYGWWSGPERTGRYDYG